MKQKFLVLSKPDKKNPGAPKVIYLRVRDGVEHYWKIRTPFVVDPAIWDENREEAKIKPTFPAETRELLGELNMRLSALKNFVSQQYAKDSLENKVDDNWLGLPWTSSLPFPSRRASKPSAKSSCKSIRWQTPGKSNMRCFSAACSDMNSITGRFIRGFPAIPLILKTLLPKPSRISGSI